MYENTLRPPYFGRVHTTVEQRIAKASKQPKWRLASLEKASWSCPSLKRPLPSRIVEWQGTDANSVPGPSPLWFSGLSVRAGGRAGRCPHSCARAGGYTGAVFSRASGTRVERSWKRGAGLRVGWAVHSWVPEGRQTPAWSCAASLEMLCSPCARLGHLWLITNINRRRCVHEIKALGVSFTFFRFSTNTVKSSISGIF